MTDVPVEVSEQMGLIELRIVTRKGVVYKANIAENIYDACWWMMDNAVLIGRFWQENINDEPTIRLEDVLSNRGYDL
jgi:hypothetical protein